MSKTTQHEDAADLFQRVIEIDPNERTRVLDEACADRPDLRDQVERLLQADDRLSHAGGRFLARPSWNLANAFAEETRPDGGELDKFRLLDEIGRGGMGIVYLAEDLSLGRQVAVKVLNTSSRPSEKAIRRFKNEARAAATANHPHIVPVYSDGNSNGHFYYSMKLIDGQSLSELMKTGSEADTEPENKGATDRPSSNGSSDSAHSRRFAKSKTRSDYRFMAELALQAAEALAHVHEQGVIHRDIKPGNMLLDNSGKVWIADFGLARIEDDAEVSRTLNPIGTLRYMAPERFQFDVVEDQRVDVYSLGVTLYELVTAKPIFESRTSKPLQHQIETVEPPTPRSISSSIPYDLETIVLKATSKDRDRRYASASALAEDLRRFLTDRPILARRPSRLDRAAKLVYRQRKVMLAILVPLFITLVVASSWLWQERSSNLNAQRTAEFHRQRSQELLTQALELLDEVFLYQFETRGRRDGGRWHNEMILTPDQRKLLRKGLELYQSLADRSKDYPDSRLNVAVAYRRMAGIHCRLGDFSKAVQPYEQAISLLTSIQVPDRDKWRWFRELSFSYRNLGHALRVVGKPQQSRQYYQKLIDLCTAGIGTMSKDGKLHLYRGLAYMSLGQPKAALEDLKVAAQRKPTPNSVALLGSAYRMSGDYDQALKTFDDALAKTEFANNYWLLRKRGRVNLSRNRPDLAIKDFERAIKAHPQPVDALVLLADTQRMMGQSADAVGPIKRALELDSRDATAHQVLGSILLDLNQVKRALASFEESLKYAQDNPLVLNGRAFCLYRLGKHREALAAFDETIQKFRKLGPAYHGRALCYQALGEELKAKADFKKAQVLMKSRSRGSPPRRRSQNPRKGPRHAPQRRVPPSQAP